jgi:hypothetical protein
VNMVNVFSIHVLIWNIKICLSHFKKGREKRENDEGMNQTKLHCMHIWKCHNEIHCTIIIY